MKKIISTLIVVLYVVPTIIHAQPLQVQTIERPPFVMEQEGVLTGFSIELWREIAEANNWEYDFKVTDTFTELLLAPQVGDADLAIANISITADREEIMDFSTPIYDGGMLMMVSKESGGNVFISALTHKLFFVPFMVFIIITIGIVFLLSQVGPKRSMREASNILVGFGKDYKRGAERLVAVVWYMVALATIVMMTVEITAVTILTEQNESISSVSDLTFKKVGVIQGSTSEAYLRSLNIKAESYGKIVPLFAAIESGSLDVVVHDAPVISHYVKNQSNGNVRIAGDLFNKEQYGIALPTGSEYTEQINQTLRRFRETGLYDDLYNNWFRE